jgi:polyisoprenyl-phosphate glycosyltransferase
MKTLTVIAPVYNEEQVIAEFYRQLKAVLLNLAPDYQSTVLFVVDRSTDETLPILEEIAASDNCVRILYLSARFGHQMSLLAGIDHSDSDVLIMMDSDLQHPPEVVPLLIGKYEEGYEIVNTIREQDSSKFLKRSGSHLFYHLINQLSEVPILESAADFRLISARVAAIFRNEIRERNQFLRGLFAWVGFSSTFVHFKSRKRVGGESKYSMGRLFQFAARGIVSFSKRPLQAAVILGFAFAFIGFLLAFVTLVQYFAGGAWPSGWATLAIIIPIFSGIQLIFLGILGEYIGAIFEEVKARPHYIVDRKINFPPGPPAL